MKPQGWWERVMVPKLICTCCGQPEIMAVRSQVVPLADGDVLELGCGGGINLQLVEPAQIRSYSGLDPSPRLLDASREAAQAKGLQADIRAGIGEAMPYADASFDTVLVTFTLCSVENAAQTLSEMRRVLRPGGKVLFAEHGRSPDAGVAKWQRRIEPIWKKIGGNCHLTRAAQTAYQAAGFTLANAGSRYMDKTPRPFGWVEWGEARV
ncbi:MAG: class I SAM-dependent methyltransferase [Sphingomonadales bacterium]|nr:class I SAM-dependent methyltransferase [Sphingomonadales bacterium]